MHKFIVNYSLEQPKKVIIATLIFVIALGAMIPSIQIDTDPENMLPEDEPSRVFHDQTKKKFGLHDMIVVGIVNTQHVDGIYNVKSLSAIHQLSTAIKKIDGVVQDDLMSLSDVDNITQEGEGTIRFEWLMKEAPSTPEQIATIKEAVRKLPMLNNTMVSGDGKAAGIYIPIESKDESYRIASEVDEIVQTIDSSDEYHITGLPVAEDTFGVEMFLQMAISAPMAGVLIFLLMWYFFRSITLIMAPMIVAMSVVISTMGMLIGMGYTVHIMSSMIPIFLMPIAVVDSVHLLSEFADNYKPGKDPKQAVREVLDHLFTPMLYTSITSAIGFASLALTPIPPVQVFGFYVAFGILLAFALTVTFIPAYIALLSPEKLAKMSKVDHSREATGLLATIVRRLGDISLAAPKTIIIFTVSLLGLSIWGITKIQINDNPVQWFEKNHPIQVADRTLNKHFAGTYNAFIVLTKTDENGTEGYLSQVQEIIDVAAEKQISLDVAHSVIKGEINNINSLDEALPQIISLIDEKSFDAPENAIPYWEELIALTERTATERKYFQSPEALQYIARMQEALLDSGKVGKSNSIADLVKSVYRELKGGDEQYFTIPPTDQAVAQTILSFLGSHRPNDLYHMVTPDYRSASLWLQLKSGDNVDMSAVTAYVDDYIDANPLPQGVKMDWAGLTYINVIWQDEMVEGMMSSLIGAFFSVFLIMIILFRSFSFGLIAMIPLTVTIASIYGFIGFIGKNYDMPVAILSSLTLGLSIDFSIHFIERCRSLFKQKGNWPDAIKEMFEDPGRAISRNAIVIAIGFTPLLLAPLTPYQTVGAFLASIMTLSCLVTLMVLPAIMNTASKFLFKTDNKLG